MSAKIISPLDIDVEVLEIIRNRGGHWAAYQNHAMDSVNAGHLQFLKYGVDCTYQEAPAKFPNDWKYLLVGFVDLTNGVVVSGS